MSSAIRVSLGDRAEALEVALGFEGRGVFLTLISPRGARRFTVAVSPDRADALATLLRQAAAASRVNGYPSTGD